MMQLDHAEQLSKLDSFTTGKTTARSEKRDAVRGRLLRG